MPMRFRLTYTRWIIGISVLALAVGMACAPGGILNNTVSLGGNTPGQRGDINVMFINNTPFRAIFTYGVYDPQNTTFGPEFEQFTVDPDPDLRLEGNSESEVATFTCGRAFSIGGEELIDRVRAANEDAELDAEALEPGITFSDRPLDDPEAGQPTAGRAPEVVTLQGAQFPCDALLIYTFEVDPAQASGFRVDLQVIAP